MTPLKFLVVGLGHGKGYLELAAKHPAVELTVVVDVNQDLRQQESERWGIRGFTSLDEALASAELDAAAIAVPTPLHAEMSSKCLEAGLHVLQEKPLCLDVAEAGIIGHAVAQAGNQVFQVGYEVRSSPLHQSILKHIRRGDLGEVTNVWYNQHCNQKKDKTWRLSRKNMGGKFFDCAVHYLDLMQQWAGAPVHRVVALGHLLGHTGPCSTELPDSISVAIEYENGIRGTFNFGARNSFHDDSSFGIAGTTGRITGNPWYPEKAGSYELREDCGVRKSNVVFDGALTSQGHLGWKEQFDNFIGSILDGAPNICPFADALATHSMMLMINRSLASGQIIAADNELTYSASA